MSVLTLRLGAQQHPTAAMTAETVLRTALRHCSYRLNDKRTRDAELTRTLAYLVDCLEHQG